MLNSTQTRIIGALCHVAAAGDTASSAHPGESSEGSEGGPAKVKKQERSIIPGSDVDVDHIVKQRTGASNE